LHLFFICYGYDLISLVYIAMNNDITGIYSPEGKYKICVWAKGDPNPPNEPECGE